MSARLRIRRRVALKKAAEAAGVPLAYDANSFLLSHSKKRSNRLFEALDIPMPRNWPACRLPLIAKPSASSGSRGVIRLNARRELDAFLKRSGPRLEGWVVQEYLEGRSYSIEVLGAAGRYAALPVTEILVDDRYDCNRVLAPVRIPATLERRMRGIALALAERIRLTGIMDVEFILHRGVPKVLEIDARLPSQTPTAVYASTGVNMLELLRDIFVGGALPRIAPRRRPRAVIYEHVSTSARGLDFPGERVMGSAIGLEVVRGFFGADAAITNFDRSAPRWVATLIVTAESPNRARAKRERVIRHIRRHLEGIAGRPVQPRLAAQAAARRAGAP